jgi:hypothetical protein
LQDWFRSAVIDWIAAMKLMADLANQPVIQWFWFLVHQSTVSY